MSASRLTEDDFSTTVVDVDGNIEIPVVELADGDYLVAYGHIDKDEFISHCNQLYNYNDPGGYSLDSDDEVLWTWARPKPAVDHYGWAISVWGVTPSDDDAFPITLVHTW